MITKQNAITRTTFVGLLIACEIVLSRILSISTPIVKLSFAFIPIALIGILYGPVYSAMAGALGDFIGALVLPIGAYFPGFTLTAGIVGLIYGLFFYKKDFSWVRIILAASIISIVFHLGLDTYWIQIISGKAYLVLLPARILKCVIMIPVQFVCIGFIWQRATSFFGKRTAEK